jgi:hypothetical protein
MPSVPRPCHPCYEKAMTSTDGKAGARMKTGVVIIAEKQKLGQRHHEMRAALAHFDCLQCKGKALRVLRVFPVPNPPGRGLSRLIRVRARRQPNRPSCTASS